MFLLSCYMYVLTLQTLEIHLEIRSIDQCTDAPRFVCLRHWLLDLSTCGKPSLVQLGTSQAAVLCKSDLRENCTCPDFGAMSIEHESHF